MVATTKTSLQECHHEGIIVNSSLYDGVVIMASLQWCHHDGVFAIMTWLQQQKHLYDNICGLFHSSLYSKHLDKGQSKPSLQGY